MTDAVIRTKDFQGGGESSAFAAGLTTRQDAVFFQYLRYFQRTPAAKVHGYWQTNL